MWLYSIKPILVSNDFEDNSNILLVSFKEYSKRSNFGPATIFLKNIAFYSDHCVASGNLELLICPTPVLLPKPHISLFSFVQRNCLSQPCPCKCELQLWLILAPDSVYLLRACVLDSELLTMRTGTYAQQTIHQVIIIAQHTVFWRYVQDWNTGKCLVSMSYFIAQSPVMH